MHFRLVAAALFLTATAHAANESAYTKLVFDGPGATCKTLKADEEGGEESLIQCDGYKGWTVFVGEGDLRMVVSYGANGLDTPAMGQTFAPFNSIGDTIEWRLKDGKPVATILRWRIDGGEGLPKGDMLVVTQLKPGQQCWIAAVSANKNADANALARQAADELAGTVTCDGGKVKVLGVPDPSIEPPE